VILPGGRKEKNRPLAGNHVRSIYKAIFNGGFEKYFKAAVPLCLHQGVTPMC